jgi:hypothetical protein
MFREKIRTSSVTFIPASQETIVVSPGWPVAWQFRGMTVLAQNRRGNHFVLIQVGNDRPPLSGPVKAGKVMTESGETQLFVRTDGGWKMA